MSNPDFKECALILPQVGKNGICGKIRTDNFAAIYIFTIFVAK